MAVSDSKGKKTEKLDVESAEERMKRLQNTFANLSSTNSQSHDGVGSRPFDFGNRETFAVEPPTDLLARVQAFLPALEASNAELAQKDPQSLDIENIGEHEERYIEMNLGLGVFEQRKEGVTSSETESSSDGGDPDHKMDSTSASSDSESDSYSDTSSEDDIITTIAKAARPTKPLPRRAHPQIEVLGSEPSSPSGAPDS